MLKTVIALAVALLLAVSVAVWQFDRAQGYRTEATDAKAAQARAEAREAKLKTTLRAVRKTYETRNRGLDEANVGREPVATDPGVYNVLCQRGNCRKLDPVRSPGD